MNPVTQSLVEQLNDPALIEWVEAWDKIEQVVIRVVRGAAVSMRDEQDFIATKRWLSRRHPDYQAVLEPYWRSAIIKGSGLATHDPFELMLAFEQASDFVGNIDAMRLLPAIRQSINEWLLDTVNARKA